MDLLLHGAVWLFVCLVLSLRSLLVDSQSASSSSATATQVTNSLPPFKFVITNAARVPDSWTVYELEMYIGHCYNGYRIPAWGGAYFSSGYRLDIPTATMDKAFDSSVLTNWTANCKQGLGGCVAYQHYIGLDVTGTPQHALAMQPNRTPADWDAILRVKCIRVWQSADPRYKADQITIQEVRPFGNTYIFNSYMYFTDVAGGTWSRRPANRDTKWRLVNLGTTTVQWGVAELRMYKDVFCSQQVTGAALSSGSGNALQHGEVNMLDGSTPTDWRANCKTTHTLPSTLQVTGCAAREAWVGLDFDDRQVWIKCFRIYQTPPATQAGVTDPPRHSDGFGLQRWLGHKWEEIDRYWSSNITYIPPSTNQVSVQAPFIGVGPGAWENAAPPDNGAWRISNDIFLSRVWEVYELEFHTDANCLGTKTTGTPVSMDGPDYQSEAQKAFDGDSSSAKNWTAWCSGPCYAEQAWIGLYYRNAQPIIHCFRIIQSQDQLYQATAVALQTWLLGKWTTLSIHRDLGGGTWNRRPAPSWSMWRVLNNVPSPGQWKVVEIKAFNDPLCLHELTGSVAPSPIGSGFKYFGDNIHNGFDVIATTAWGADCTSCNRTRFYWIGAQLNNVSAQQQSTGKKLVQCVQIWQSSSYAEQVESIRVDVWTGQDWTVGDIGQVGVISTTGGGIWDRVPAQAMSKWRLRPTRKSQGNVWQRWRLRELEFYSDSNCTVRLRVPQLGGTEVVMSGYIPEITGYQLSQIANAQTFTEGNLAFDSNLDTGVVLSHEPQTGNLASFGIDFRSETTWVRCVRLVQGNLAPEQSLDLAMEFWDGLNWTDKDPEISTHERLFQDLGGGGWQRRPALPNTIWRIENLDTVPEGWAVYEVEFHESASCSIGPGAHPQGLRGEPIASGFVPLDELYGQQNAFDGDVTTAWSSQCSEIMNSYKPTNFQPEPVGCTPREAWIGMDFRLARRDVRCIRVMQVGYETMQSGSVAVSRWNGSTWTDAWIANGLGGSMWDQRPALPNSMWRVVNVEPRGTKCKREGLRQYPRLWGISELELYADDDCSNKLRTGVPVTSGTVEKFRKTVYDRDNYTADTAFDGIDRTEWAANCKMGWKQMNTSNVNCVGKWLGLNFRGRSVEVRCIKIMQSRRESSACCDPSKKIRLDRWNGTQWVEASWLHTPRKGSSVSPMYLGASFVEMGSCPLESYSGRPEDYFSWDQRGRRDSDSCIVPLTGATVLLGEPACIEHAACQEAFGPGGQCCPIGGVNSRCCCSYLEQEDIFVDEDNLVGIRHILKIEHAFILLADYVPFVACLFSLIFYFGGICLSEDAQERLIAWSEKPGAGCCCRRCCCGSRCRWLLMMLLYPLVSWRKFLSKDMSLFGIVGRWFVRPRDGVPRGAEWSRMLIFVVIFTFIGGVSPYLAMGALLGQGALFVLFMFGLTVRWSKSPYKLDNEWDMELRENIAEQPLHDDIHLYRAVDVAREFLATMVLSVVYFLKFIFDLLVCRAQLISYEAIDSIEAERVLDIFPGIVELLRDPGLVIYKLMYWASQVIGWLIGYFIGIPGCEGSCVLIGSVCLVMVLLALTKFLNYDFFALFTAARQVNKSVHPPCQRALYQGMNMVALSLTFGSIQCAMVLFSRALKVASPFRQSEWACEWNDLMAIILGKGLIVFSTFVGVTFFFLCANGHFMGQDYIVKPVAKFMRIDLDDLDPDGTGPDGGLFQCAVQLPVLPTLVGVWFDFWNIKGYLIKERADIYAQQLLDPQPCVHCGEIHVKYTNVMCATGRQISLACQILPLGILIGKASEYCNDPPLIYIGERLVCCQIIPEHVEPRPVLGKGKLHLKALLLIADVATLCNDYGIPVFRRLVSLGLYVFLLVGVFGITNSNLVEMGKLVIEWGFYLAIMKAAGETLLEVLMSWIVNLVHDSILEVKNKITQNADVARTVAGQVGSGAVVSTIVVVSAQINGQDSQALAIVVATLVGIGVSWITLFVNWMLEFPPPEPGFPRRGGVFRSMVKFVFAGAIAAVTSLFTQDAFPLRTVISFCIAVTCTEMIVMKLILVEESTLVAENKFDGCYRPEDGEMAPEDLQPDRTLSSPTKVVLTSKYCIPGPVGILVAAALGISFRKVVPQLSVATTGAFISVLFGVPSGLVAGLAMNNIMERRELVFAVFVGAITCLLVSLWNTFVGGVCGVIAGVGVGSLLEEIVVRQKLAFDVQDRIDKQNAKDEAARNAQIELEKREWANTIARRSVGRAIEVNADLFPELFALKDEDAFQVDSIAPGTPTHKPEVTHGVPPGTLALDAAAHEDASNIVAADNVLQPIENAAAQSDETENAAPLLELTAEPHWEPLLDEKEAQQPESDVTLRGSADAESNAIPIPPRIEAFEPPVPPPADEEAQPQEAFAKTLGNAVANIESPARARRSRRSRPDIVDGFNLEKTDDDERAPSSPSGHALSLSNAWSSSSNLAAKPKPPPEHVANRPLFEGTEVADNALYGRWEHRKPTQESRLGRHPEIKVTYKAPGTSSIWDQRVKAAPPVASFAKSRAAVRNPQAYRDQLQQERDRKKQLQQQNNEAQPNQISQQQHQLQLEPRQSHHRSNIQ